MESVILILSITILAMLVIVGSTLGSIIDNQNVITKNQKEIAKSIEHIINNKK